MKRTDRLVERCRIIMSDGSWWRISDMAAALGCTETGASARIRDQRKAKFGGHRIEKRLRSNTFEYRMVPAKSRLGRTLGEMLASANSHYAVDRLSNQKETVNAQ